MALLKIWRTIRQQGMRNAYKKVARVAPGYLSGVPHWKLRRCQCCQKFTIFVQPRNASSDFRACLFCSANGLYEMLANEIRDRFGSRLAELDVLELDPHSPLRGMLSEAQRYVRSFYEEGCRERQRNGAVCEDITALSFEERSFDLIVSSEVLEHVPRLEKAFSETARVLRPGGAHIFTVPPRESTKKRAEIVDGEIIYLEPPEYHLDPLNPKGILAFWDIGPDLPNAVPSSGLNVRIVKGPVGDLGRVVWIAERTE
jgi:SAM-dependent methyltransferase